LTAADLVRRRTAKGPDPTARENAAEWLAAELLNGPRKATEIKILAEKAGISEGTLKRAKAELGVVAKQVSRQAHGGWTWELPSRSPDEEFEELMRGQGAANRKGFSS